MTAASRPEVTTREKTAALLRATTKARTTTAGHIHRGVEDGDGDGSTGGGGP